MGVDKKGGAQANAKNKQPLKIKGVFCNGREKSLKRWGD